MPILGSCKGSNGVFAKSFFALGWVFILLVNLNMATVSAFTVPSSLSINRHSISESVDFYGNRGICLKAVDKKASGQIDDSNGKTMEAGTVVRVAAEDIRVFQIPAKGRGTFNDKKEFVPAVEDPPRRERNLLLPVGMRGVVTRVHPSDTANYPVFVKFTPGEHMEEGYDPPAGFLFHFKADEVECV